MSLTKKILILLGSLVILNTAVAGCSPVEKTIKLLIGSEEKKNTEVTLEPLEKNGEQQDKNTGTQEVSDGTGKTPVETKNSSTDKGQQSANLTNKSSNDSSTQTENSTGQVDSSTGQAASSEKIQVVLYFGSKDGTNLVGEIREINKVPGLARATIEELLKGPTPASGLGQTIPTGVKLLDINLKPDGLAIVNFSEEIKTKHWGGSCGEQITIYSIVNTLTQFASIQKVQFLIDNQAVETLAGHAALDQPLERNSEIIKAK